jgi:predicted MFS family arabinose efflux permease
MTMSAQAAAEDLTGIPAEHRVVPLRRNLQFQALWAGQAASSLGVSVADVAYPLAILALTGSPARAGLFAAFQTAGMMAGALPGGKLADRYDRRTIVIITEAARALVTATVAVFLIMGRPSLATLLLAAATLGVGQAISGAARLPLVRSVVPDEQLTSALVQEEVRQNGASLAGPPLAGALYAIRALEHSVPFVFTGAAFVFSMLAAVAMKRLPGGQHSDASGSKTESSPGQPDDSFEAREASRRESGMLAGLRALWASPLLRAAMLLIMVANSVGVGLDLVIIVVLRGQHVRPGLIGLVLAAAAVGGLAGTPLVKPLHRLKPGVLLLTVCLLDIPFIAGLALPFGPWWVASMLFLSALAVPAIRVLIDVLIFRQTPDEQRGRVAAAVMTLIGIGMPAGLAGSGLLLQWLPARAAVLTLAAVMAAGVLYCASKRALWRAQWPI